MGGAPIARLMWLSRRADTHCVRGPRDVTGADIVRVAKALAIEPRHFTQEAPAAVDDPAGIVLDNGRRRVMLTMANAAQGCVFLLRVAGGEGRCGLGDLAPLACHIFPLDPRSAPGGPAGADDEAAEIGPVGPDLAVPPDLTPAQVAEVQRTWADDQAHWHEAVGRWNRGAGRPDDKPLGSWDFQRYLLEAQAARAAGRDWPEEVTP